MTAARPVGEHLSFVGPGGDQRLLCVAEPAGGPTQGLALLLPPFAEEQNKTRRMCAEFARRAAARGWRVLRLDLYGTGDSAGEFVEARWATWEADLTRLLAAERAARPDLPVVLWAVRGGALWLPALLEHCPDANLLLWQPVLAGQVHLQQFLRLHGAARLVAGAAEDTAGPSAAQLLASGQVVEVAGYELHPDLAQALRAAACTLPAQGRGRLAFLEVGAAGAAEASAPVRRACETLAAAGRAVTAEVVPGEAFWQTTETTEVPALLEASERHLDAFAAARAPAMAQA